MLGEKLTSVMALIVSVFSLLVAISVAIFRVVLTFIFRMKFQSFPVYRNTILANSRGH